jgi:Domain of unknown function (DUF5671)
MATAKRLYLYGVSAAGLGMLVSAAAVLLHLLLNKAGIGPQIAGSSTAIGNADRDLLSVAIPVGIIGLILWLTHWGALERIVHRADETAAAERASIVRSVFFAVALSATLLAAAGLGVDLLTKSLSNIIDPAKVSSSSSGFTTGPSTSALLDDAWSLAIIILAFGAWAYHAWIRARDLRQGTFIGGAAAWISRFYLYGAALMGLGSLIVAVSSIISTAGSEVFKDSTTFITPSGNPIWQRAVIAALVSLVIWAIVWLIHWLYSNRLRSGRGTTTEQNLAERTSRVRLAYITSLVFIGAITVISSLASSLGFLFLKLLGYEMTSAMLGYFLVVPPLATVPVAVVWFLHRRRGIGESAQNLDGISGRRIAAYLTVIAAIYELAFGAASALGAVFGEWFAVRGPGPSYPSSSTPPAFDMWKYSFAIGLAGFLVGFAFWVWPWFTSQRRRRSEGEIGSSSRSYYLYLIVGTSILILAGTLAWILYRYLRVAFGLPEANLGPEISMTLALALVVALLFVYHGLVLRGDSKPRQYQPTGLPAWPGSPGPVAYPPAAPMYAPPGAYQPAPPAWQPAPMPPVAPAPAAPEATPPSDAKPEAGA